MSDLVVHSSLLDDLKHTFSTITDRMDSVRKVLGRVDGTAVGASNLVGDLHDYADDWSYGVGQIGKHTDSAGKLIDQVGKTFDDADVKLANALTKAGTSS